MSALPAPQFELPVSTNDSVEWLPLAEVARRLGLSPGHTRRLCATKYANMGLAHLREGEWHVHPGADPRLADAASQSEFLIRDDFKAMPAAQQTAAMQRAECVRRFRDAKLGRQGAVAVWLPGLLAELATMYPQLKLTRATMYRWDKRAGQPIDVMELVDWRGHACRQRGGMGAPPAWEHFISQYLSGNQPSLRDCWRRTRAWADARALDWCSLHSCRRQLDQRISPERQAYHREPAKWRSKFATYHEQHPERHPAGDCWVGDHRPLDVICRLPGKPTGGRPVITIWHDWRTRKVVGWHLSTAPNSDTIIAAFGMAVKDPANLGPPRIAWMDNGKDFDSLAIHGRSKRERKAKLKIDETWFGGVFGALGVEAHFSLPHGPQGKGRCERWFATMAIQLDKLFGTYTGRDPTRKPEGLAGRIGQGAAKAPEFSAVRDAVAAFIAAYNANADHQMDLRDDETQRQLSPGEAYAAWTSPRVLADPAALDLCLMPHTRPVTVGRQGVRVALPGCPPRYYGQYEEALRTYKGTGKKVYVAYDPSDLRQVQVRDDKLGLICIAPVNGDTGVYGAPESREVLKAAEQKKKNYNKGLKLERDNQDAAYLSDNDLIQDEAAKIAQTSRPTRLEPDPDHPLRLVQTPFDGQSKELEMQQLRKAAGAESQTFSGDQLPDLDGLWESDPPATADRVPGAIPEANFLTGDFAPHVGEDPELEANVFEVTDDDDLPAIGGGGWGGVVEQL